MYPVGREIEWSDPGQLFAPERDVSTPPFVTQLLPLPGREVDILERKLL